MSSVCKTFHNPQWLLNGQWRRRLQLTSTYEDGFNGINCNIFQSETKNGMLICSQECYYLVVSRFPFSFDEQKRKRPGSHSGVFTHGGEVPWHAKSQLKKPVKSLAGKSLQHITVMLPSICLCGWDGLLCIFLDILHSHTHQPVWPLRAITVLGVLLPPSCSAFQLWPSPVRKKPIWLPCLPY